jgi:DNA invertase Pin-like site-specific DNA recombinase
MRKFYGYIRVSTVKQGEQGVSLQAQKEAISGYALRNDLEVVAWFEEKETAAKRGRPIFNQVVRLLNQGKAEGVIIHKIDRGARNLKDWADLGELIDQGIEVHTANEGLDLNSRGGRLSADIQAVIAADYIRNLREETRKGFYGRIKQGIYPLPAPLGYLDQGKGKAKEIDPVKGPLVRKVFELYGSGRFSFNRLLEETNLIGLQNRKGRRISKNGLSSILNNPFYIGLIRLKRTGELFPGIHRPLISKALFDRVQAILSGKTVATLQKYNFRFKRVLRCGSCKYALTGEIQKGYIYYRCHTRECPKACVREEIVEEAILKVFSALQLNELEQKYFHERVAIFKEMWGKERELQISSLKLTIGQLQDRLGRLIDAFVDQSLEKDLFEQRKEAILMEKKTLEDKLANLVDEIELVPEKMQKFFELMRTVYLNYKLGQVEEKRDFLKIITSNLLVSGKNVEIELKFPFREVLNRDKTSYGVPYQDRLRTKLDALFEKLCDHFSRETITTQEEYRD